MTLIIILDKINSVKSLLDIQITKFEKHVFSADYIFFMNDASVNNNELGKCSEP